MRRRIADAINVLIPVLFGYVMMNDNEINKAVHISALNFGSSSIEIKYCCFYYRKYLIMLFCHKNLPLIPLSKG